MITPIPQNRETRSTRSTKTEATLSQPSATTEGKRTCSQRVAGGVGKNWSGPVIPTRRLTSLSQQIVYLNNAIVGDPSLLRLLSTAF